MKNNGRADVLAVWGSPGSGKSVFSGLLAAVLEHRKNKVIIFSPNILTPMLPVFFPQETILNRCSIGHIFEQLDITEAEIAKHIFFSKAHKDIGVLAYAPGDTAMRYPDTTKKQVETLIDSVSRMADTVILDCSSDMREVFPYVAIASADVTVKMLSADLRGISFLAAQKPLLSAPQFRYEDHMTILGAKRTYQSDTGFDKDILTFPWKQDIETAYAAGKLFDAPAFCGKEHLTVLETAADKLKGGSERDEKERNPGDETAGNETERGV